VTVGERILCALADIASDHGTGLPPSQLADLKLVEDMAARARASPSVTTGCWYCCARTRIRSTWTPSGTARQRTRPCE